MGGVCVCGVGGGGGVALAQILTLTPQKNGMEGGTDRRGRCSPAAALKGERKQSKSN